MKCPICKAECGSHTVCNECGFTEVGKLFINQEDAQQWMFNVVLPFKNMYEKKNILPPLNWTEVFKKDARAKALFEVTIPVAKKKQAALQYTDPGDSSFLQESDRIQRNAAALGHIVLKSTNVEIDRHFVEEVCQAMGLGEPARTLTLNGFLKPGDLASVLSNLDENGLLVFEVSGKMKKELHDVLLQALEEFILTVQIGKGPMARSISLDIPAFTALFIVSKIEDIPSSLHRSISSIIEMNFSKEELFEYQIREVADKQGLILTDKTLNVFKQHSLTVGAKQAIKFVADYLFLHQEIIQPISDNVMQDILSTIC